MYPDH
ncbi:unnamed protein product [Staurois parvus]